MGEFALKDVKFQEYSRLKCEYLLKIITRKEIIPDLRKNQEKIQANQNFYI